MIRSPNKVRALNSAKMGTPMTMAHTDTPQARPAHTTPEASVHESRQDETGHDRTH